MDLSKLDQIHSLFERTWPPAWLDNQDFSFGISQLLDVGRRDRTTTLPFVLESRSRVVWAVLGPTVREVRDYFDDCRSWLESSDERGITGNVVLPGSGGQSELTQAILSVSPEGYGRFESTLDRTPKIVSRLGMMARFLETKPNQVTDYQPSLASLRRSFITAIRVGDWVQANSSIGEIDRNELDRAENTLHMRIRLYEAQGNWKDLFALVEKERAWILPTPRRVAVAIMKAFEICVLNSVEMPLSVEESFLLFKEKWYGQLANLIYTIRDVAGFERIQAMSSLIDRDQSKFEEYVNTLPDPIRQALLIESRSVFPPNSISNDTQQEQQSTSTSPEANNFWDDFLHAVKNLNQKKAKSILGKIDLFVSDIRFLSGAPDAVTELLTSDILSSSIEGKILVQDSMCLIIDAFIQDERFPRSDHEECYIALLDGMSILYEQSNRQEDSQLFLGLVSACLDLSSRNTKKCEDLIRVWWDSHRTVSRLNWLVSALEKLASMSSDSGTLTDLYVDGLSLAVTKSIRFSEIEVWSWKRVGGLIELSKTDISNYLEPCIALNDESAVDPLHKVKVEQIAIISLQESSARQASEELRRRTGAEVRIITSLVSDAQAKHAKNADLILYVWASSSHATFRTFDTVRDRIEYVQGTGASSILLAAERWAERMVKNELLGGV